MEKNPNWYGRDNGIDRIVFRVFTNADAMVAAAPAGRDRRRPQLQRQLRSSSSRPPTASKSSSGSRAGSPSLRSTEAPGGIGDGHPALQDVDVRHAIYYSIDREAMFQRVDLGLGAVGTTLSPSADPTWIPDLGDETFTYDPDRGRTRSSTTPATSTPTATACARCPTAAGRSSSATSSVPSRRPPRPIREFITALAGGHRHRHDGRGDGRHPAVRRPTSRATTTCSCGAGRRTSIPTRCSVVLHVRRGQHRRPTATGANDANWCIRSTTSCTKHRRSSSIRNGAARSSHEMLRLFNTDVDVSRAAPATPTSRPTARTVSRGGCSNRPKPVRWCSRTSPTYSICR